MQGAVASSSGIAVGRSSRPLTSKGNGPASEIRHQPARVRPAPHRSPLSSHFSLEPLVSKHHQEGRGEAGPFVAGSVWQAACTLMAA